MPQQKQRYCRACSRKTLHVKGDVQKIGCAPHVILTICTCGLWLIVAPLIVGLEMFAALGQPWRCQSCGRRN